MLPIFGIYFGFETRLRVKRGIIGSGIYKSKSISCCIVFRGDFQHLQCIFPGFDTGTPPLRLRLRSGSDPVVEQSRNSAVERSRNPVVERSRNHCIPVSLPFLSCSPPVLLLCLSLSSPYPLPILSLSSPYPLPILSL